MIEKYVLKPTLIRMKIILEDEIPVYQKPRQLSIPEKKGVEGHLHDWLDEGIITQVR